MRILVSANTWNADKYHKVTNIVIPKRIVEALKIKSGEQFKVSINKKGQIIYSRNRQSLEKVE